MTGPVSQLRTAETTLIQQIDAMTAAVEQIATTSLDAALPRLQAAAGDCARRHALAILTMGSIVGELVRGFSTSAEDVRQDLAGTEERAWPAPVLTTTEEPMIDLAPIPMDRKGEAGVNDQRQAAETVVTVAACSPVATAECPACRRLVAVDVCEDGCLRVQTHGPGANGEFLCAGSPAGMVEAAKHLRVDDAEARDDRQSVPVPQPAAKKRRARK